jgi:hypothetical protein
MEACGARTIGPARARLAAAARAALAGTRRGLRRGSTPRAASAADGGAREAGAP